MSTYSPRRCEINALLKVCGVFGAQWFLQASIQAQANRCIFIAVVPAPIAVRYDSKNCY